MNKRKIIIGILSLLSAFLFFWLTLWCSHEGVCIMWLRLIVRASCLWFFASGLYLLANRSALTKRGNVVATINSFYWLLLVVAMVVLPNVVKSQARPCGNACINNMRQLDAAANQLALEKALKTGDNINYPNDLTPYIKLNR